MKRFLLVVLSACLLSGSARAGVVFFGFTGFISDEVLQSGFYQNFGPNNPAWLGRSVSGTIRMDLDAAFRSYWDPGRIQQFSKTQDHPYTDWMTVTLDNPDGSRSVIRSGPPANPAPVVEGDDALTYLSHTDGDSAFYAQRTYTNGVSYPQQQFAISVRAVGAGSERLTNGVDFDSALIDVGAANWDNYGFMRDESGPGQPYGYAFMVQSVALLPEPPVWGLLLLAGAAGVVSARPKRRA